MAKGANLSQKEEFVKVIRDTLTKIMEEGIDKKAVTAGINYYEFRFREADFSSYPKGLMYGLDILSSWLYDDTKPFCEVQLLEGFEFLKKALEEGYFEDLIRKYLLDNTHGAILSLVPEKGLAAKRDKELEEKLHARKDEKKEQEELTKNIVEAANKQAGGADSVAQAQQEIKDMMNKLKLIEDDVKGAAVDQGI